MFIVHPLHRGSSNRGVACSALQAAGPDPIESAFTGLRQRAGKIRQQDSEVAKIKIAVNIEEMPNETFVVDSSGIYSMFSVIGGCALAFGDFVVHVPAVSEWGMVLMTLLLLSFGTLVYGRRRGTHA